MYFLTLIAQDDSSGGSGIASLGILLLIPVAMYFLMIRPQRKRMRDQAAMQTSLEVGDEIVTTSGMYGFITGFDDDRVWVEIDDDVQVRVAKAAIQGKVDTSATTETRPDSVADSVDDDADDTAAGDSSEVVDVGSAKRGKRPRAGGGGGGKEPGGSLGPDAPPGAARDDSE